MVDQHYWFAPIVARPIPELPDAVTVGLAFGNGRLEHIEYDHELERLKGMWSVDHRAVLAVALRYATRNIRELKSINDLSSMLGVQFCVEEPRPLLAPYSIQVVRALRRSYLDMVKSPRDSATGLQRESLRALDREIDSLLPGGVTYRTKPIPLSDLYPGVAERYETAQIPAVQRMLQFDNRDLVLGSVIVRMQERAHLDQLVQRTIRQFYFLDRLREPIRQRSGKEVRTVGVIQPLEANATGETRMLHEMISEQWTERSDHVIVLHSTKDAQELLGPEMRWVHQGTPVHRRRDSD